MTHDIKHTDIPSRDINFRRIVLYPLVLETGTCFSYGVQRDKKFRSGTYSIPIVMEEDSPFIKEFDDIVKKCKDILVEHREEIEWFNLELSDLDKLGSCLYTKGKRPTLYVKLDRDSILLEGGRSVSPSEYVDRQCDIEAKVRIESIFVSHDVISLQVKLREATLVAR